ncbi:DUF2238 domain-containing protein [Candidatus Saccharibacteria bacterium]|nr:DUF2238 domain-containing protein [Candidatus Saccharibacteria bacterium]
MNRTQRVLLILIQASLIIIALALLVIVIIEPEYNKYGGVIAGLTLPLLPNIIQKLFKAKISFRLQLTYFIFLFFALFLGICFDFYKTVPHFDKVIHFFSGILTVIIAWYALKFFKVDKTDKRFQALFIICFCIAVAAIWEYFEFTSDKLLGTNMQELLEPGVDDTMFDMIFATIGACVGTIILMRYTKAIEKFSLEDHRKK